MTPGTSRRAALAGLAAGAASLAWPGAARAGAQVEEPLADAVRSALSSAIASSAPPPELKFDSVDAHVGYIRWLAAMSERRIPTGVILVAEVEHELVAAVPLDGGPPLSDISRPTADVIQLLELRSNQLRRAARAA